MPRKTRNAKLLRDEEDGSKEDDNSGSDSDEEEEEQEEDRFHCPKCGEKLPKNSAQCASCQAPQQSCCPCSRVCWSSCIFGIAFVVVAYVLTIFFNSWLKTSLEQIGGAVLGTDVTLQAVNFSPIEGRIHFTELAIDSPTPFKGNFLSLEEFVLDVDPLSLSLGCLLGFSAPLVMEEVKLKDCNVDIVVDMVAAPLPTSTSNAQSIANHANDVTHQLTGQGANSPQPIDETMAAHTAKAMPVKIKIGRLTLSNIKVGVRISSLPEATFNLATIELTDIGKDKGGVYPYELIDILVQSLLMAVLKASPDSVQAFLAGDLRKSLSMDGLDLGDLNFDSGHGPESIGAFSGWAAGQASLIPLRAASLGASMTEKALEAGSKITSMQNSANMAMANANLKMGEKATEEFGKLTTGFANGFASVLNHN
mmetsp:Transcript_37883/g.80206  ORF Transcript_37883/g.80206 Transcript_37883/m.80206 type:complete len:423 (-) Transcript_37883:404-1672(-)|eukprot:CAMPEP_0206421558 /NCGR_PEP_ID=MMETSP0324_2-20121206/1516_1 /ASSEMBLY_ACC=CAM_ASM_000836 /TAXON_ID=2866 /ORGANISM="Crypthecodinium cohnii, Strain Seligo" /LENGTH=422 /DNA_ID=CAMNT_0053885669 /DNA_START=24 /DNA_END=1292 /DNA_ORIENTATION=+